MYHYLAFLVIGESVLIFIPFITGIAQDATGYSKKEESISIKLTLFDEELTSVSLV